MKTIFITNDVRRAQIAERSAVDTIMVDLEIIGKSERQKDLDTLISHHTLADVKRVRSVLHRALLMVRVNPMHQNTKAEVEGCIDAGADVLMLPMISYASEVERLVHMVEGRSKICLLLETAASLARLHDILDVPGIDEVHIGINDLHLSMKLDFMFEVMTGGIIEYMAQAIKHKGLRFGVGGIARLGEGLVSPALILSEHLRLGSSQVILSRDFNRIFEQTDDASVEIAFRREIGELHKCVLKLQTLEPELQESNTQALKRAVCEVVRRRLGQRTDATGK